MSRAATGISRAGVRATTGPETPFRIASLTKVVTGAALVRALGVPLDTPAVSLLPELAADWSCDRGITVEHLLAQVAGLREAVDASTVAALGDGPDALLEAARLVVRAGSDRAPGARWSYY
ncbi:serine hydrolase domain-containing protein [Actinoplanes sp. NPDC048791]|uniref:serine hydrolase domain-containing protein n=1 Tax=Actinoplanes sp. NPDC048791 TaxID=3154623 RepID=UPI0033C6349E